MPPRITSLFESGFERRDKSILFLFQTCSHTQKNFSCPTPLGRCELHSGVDICYHSCYESYMTREYKLIVDVM